MQNKRIKKEVIERRGDEKKDNKREEVERERRKMRMWTRKMAGGREADKSRSKYSLNEIIIKNYLKIEFFFLIESINPINYRKLIATK